MIDFWKTLSRSKQVGLISGCIIIAIMTGAIAWWTLRPEYHVLFTDLKAQDANAMIEELERIKTPYKLSNDGTTILVDAATVHATRLKLMGKDLSLQGVVGLEIFNNTDFGMTEFAQRVNFQRALQGEIARTIQSLVEVKDVRVLLALPEHGLFKQSISRPKASVTIGLKPGYALQAGQVQGIQRLVAASVTGMTLQDVTIVDSQGRALTRHSDDVDGLAGAAAGRLDLKREMDAYLTKKVMTVLEQAFGLGQAIASVDVVLNADLIKVTTEDVLPGGSQGLGRATGGIVVREREMTKDQMAPIDGKGGVAVAAARSGGTQREVEYAVGRRLEEVVTQPGSIRRIHAVAVVKKVLDAAEETRLQTLIASAVGASLERGDRVVVHDLAALPRSDENPETFGARGQVPERNQNDDHSEKNNITSRPNINESGIMIQHLLKIIGVLLFGVIVVMSLYWRGWLIRRRSTVISIKPMTEHEREAALHSVLNWLQGQEPVASSAAVSSTRN